MISLEEQIFVIIEAPTLVRGSVGRELARMSYLSDEKKKALGIPNDSIGGEKVDK